MQVAHRYLQVYLWENLQKPASDTCRSKRDAGVQVQVYNPGFAQVPAGTCTCTLLAQLGVSRMKQATFN